jgi:hypothetical protein
LIRDVPLGPNEGFTPIKILDATPEIVAKYALSDEQALLAKVRYNRLIDVFSGVTCYSLQNHLRTTVPEMGQVETDELYIGVDKRGVQYVFPVQAKGGRDKLNVVQIEQDFGMCEAKFPALVCRPIAVQFMPAEVIAMFELRQSDTGVGITAEQHYKLVRRDEITEEELRQYGRDTRG